MNRYVAFLRGINAGGNETIKMDDLRRAFESLKLGNVATVLASGNVIFDSPETDRRKLARDIGARLSKAFGHEKDVLVRTAEDIRGLVESEPFKDIEVTPQTRLYVTFLSAPYAGALEIPCEPPGKDIRILKVTAGEVCSVVELTDRSGTPGLMKLLDDEFGREITTRNWNTVIRIHSRMAAQ
jgi:uncharacterized protein (DUF1697 family)